jgi:hypothetical protein
VDGLSAVSLDVASIASAQLAYIQPQQKHPHPAMDAAAKLLGMSSSDLRTALQSGQSLVSIASSKGISQDALVGAMASAIQEANPDISTDQATKVATAIATRVPPAASTPNGPAVGPASEAPSNGAATGTTAADHKHGHHRHHAAAAAMDAAAKVLGTTTSDLVSSLQSGQSLATIASAKGVSQDDLIKAISSALSQADSSLSTDQATQLATAMVTGPATPDPSRQWAAAPSATASTFAILA